MIPSDYLPKTTPWVHQAEAFAISADLPNYAYFFEQRCGKTKPVIDKTAYQFERGEIDALLVVALPSGVHRNWITDEVPAHLPDRIPRMCVAWDSRRAGTKKDSKGRVIPRHKGYAEALESLIRFPGLSILTANGEALRTRAFDDFMKRFLRARRIHLVGDETTLIMKSKSTDMASAMRAYRKHPSVLFAAIMDGTPVGEGPFDLFSQFLFLSPAILGYTSFFAFKQRYASWTKDYRWDEAKQERVEYPVLEAYQNLDELYEKIRPVSYRITRKEAFPFMPDQVVVPVRFELSDEQVRVHDRLAEEYEAELRDGTRVTAAMVLTRQLRLQQVASNFWPSVRTPTLCGLCSGDGCEACDMVGAVVVETEAKVIDPRHDPRLEALDDQLSRTREPFIVWCRFTRDVDAAMEACIRRGINTVRYDGKVTPDCKAANKAAFQSGQADALVGNPTSGGRGLTLKRARTVYNYSHFFSLLVYLQGNDRGEDTSLDVRKEHRGTCVVNLLAVGTVDEDIDEAHRAKASVADVILKRPRGEMFRRING